MAVQDPKPGQALKQGIHARGDAGATVIPCSVPEWFVTASGMIYSMFIL